MAATKDKQVDETKTQLELLTEMRGEIAALHKRFDGLEARLATTKSSSTAVTVKGTARVCQRGHAMQVSDDYCQHCWREDHPNVQAGRFRPPRANKPEIIPLGDPPSVLLPEIPEPPEPTAA